MYRQVRSVRDERGYTFVVLTIVICVVSVALVQSASTLIAGAFATDAARLQLDVRIACRQLLTGPLPLEVGGSIAPEPPVEGFSDVVVVDRETGSVRPLTQTSGIAGPVVLRQWRLRDLATGERVFEVSGVAVDAGTLAPRSGYSAARSVQSIQVR
jgi:hypothetical protein